LKQISKRKRLSLITSKRKGCGGGPWHYQRALGFKEFFEECEKQKEQHGKYFEEFPIFVAHFGSGWRAERKIEYNACLKEYEFYRMVDTYTAFQEVAMFWGGLAQPNRPTPEVTDKDMVTAKGFNKWSFRKEPTKKR